MILGCGAAGTLNFQLWEENKQQSPENEVVPVWLQWNYFTLCQWIRGRMLLDTRPLSLQTLPTSFFQFLLILTVQFNEVQ